MVQKIKTYPASYGKKCNNQPLTLGLYRVFDTSLGWARNKYFHKEVAPTGMKKKWKARWLMTLVP
jgi:hypothetical protein